jgi:hypothetical protein
MKAFFAPLMAKSLLYCSVRETRDSSIVCGKYALADISNSFSQQIKVTTPSNLNDFFSTDSLSNKKYLPYLNTNESGTYKVFSGNHLLDYFSVNHDPRESVLESVTESEFEDYLKQIGYEGKFISLSTNTDYLKEIYQSRFGIELWKYFLIIVLLLAVAESLLARNSKKDLTT